VPGVIGSFPVVGEEQGENSQSPFAALPIITDKTRQIKDLRARTATRQRSIGRPLQGAHNGL